MRNNLFLAGFLFLFNCSLSGQGDSIPPTATIENISTATLKAKEMSIDLANAEEVELALKKIHTFKYLETLILEGETDENTLQKLFYRLSVSKNLVSLTLRENELTKIPENITGLKNLQTLTVEGNVNLDYNDLCARLKTISLTQLNLIDNDLKETPAGLGELVTLRKIELSGSQQLDYAGFVEQLARLPGLTTLSIPVNYMTELPKNIDKLKSLQVLDVSNNTLAELPPEISALKAINRLSIQGNLLLDPVKDLEKLKGNIIQYLALDREISGEDVEQIKKMFPGAQVDFPVNKEEEEPAKIQKTAEMPAPAVYSGELKVKKEARILSGAYLLNPALFLGPVYNFDTLSFEERYRDLRYENVYQIVNNGAWRGGTFYFRKWLTEFEQPGKKNETWFRFPVMNQTISVNYPESRAFLGMYWVYKGELSKKEFEKKYLVNKQRPEGTTLLSRKKRKRKTVIQWNDIRVLFDKNNSLFTLQVKTDTGFSEFKAYPVLANLPVEKSLQTYNRRFLLYQKTLLRRAQRFSRLQARNKARYDADYKKVKDYAWKQLQLRMSNEEKTMSREEWLQYYDAIVANEQTLLDNSSLSLPYILRSLQLRGYTMAARTGTAASPVRPDRTAPANYSSKTVNIDFVDARAPEKLTVTNILVLDTKNKVVSQANGTLGLLPNLITLQQFSSYVLLVELRNGSWGVVSPEEIDRRAFEPNKTYQLITTVVDKNLGTIGTLLKSGIN